MEQLKKIDIEKWAYALIKKHNLTYKAYTNMAIILKQSLEYLIDLEAIDSSPYSRVKIDRRVYRKVRKKAAETQVYFEDEQQALIELAERLADETGDELYYAVALLFKTGMRIGECLALSFADFMEESGSLYIHASLKAIDCQRKDGTWETRRHEIWDYLKGNGDPREILITKDCFDIAEKVRHLQETKGISYDGYLFHTVTPSDLENKIRRLCERLDIRIRSPHKMRKTYISTLLNNNMDPDFVRTQAGQKELQTTFNSYTYSTTRPERLLQTLESIL